MLTAVSMDRAEGFSFNSDSLATKLAKLGEFNTEV